MVFKPQTFYGEPASPEIDPHSDAALEARVAAALAQAGDIDATNVAVTAVGSRIVLSGTVALQTEAGIAEDIASRVSGVGGVENLLAAVG